MWHSTHATINTIPWISKTFLSLVFRNNKQFYSMCDCRWSLFGLPQWSPNLDISSIACTTCMRFVVSNIYSLQWTLSQSNGLCCTWVFPKASWVECSHVQLEEKVLCHCLLGHCLPMPQDTKENLHFKHPSAYFPLHDLLHDSFSTLSKEKRSYVTCWLVPRYNLLHGESFPCHNWKSSVLPACFYSESILGTNQFSLPSISL